MKAVPPPSDESPRAATSCPSCRAPATGDQRYCLDCGALVGNRRLDPIGMLTTSTPAAELRGDPRGTAAELPGGPAGTAAEPRGGPLGTAAELPGGPRADGGAPRAVPLAAATAAIVVAGISGMLVANGGSGNGARAAVVATAAATATPPPAAPVTPAPASEAAAAPNERDADPPPAAASPPDDFRAAEPPPTTPKAPPTGPDTDDAPDDEANDEPAAADPPRVWLLALEGPHAADAIERIAKQGVRLSAMASVAATAQANARALISGERPAAVDPTPPTVPVDPAAVPAPTADRAAADAAPAIPVALTAAKRTWRAYIDAQPTDGPVLPGACTAPAADDPTATLVASRLPFAGIQGIDCATSVTGLETLGNDLSSGDDVPSFSYVALGGCAPPERTAVALPDAVEDTVATITSSTEFQQDGLLVVTTVGTQDPRTPIVPPAAAEPHEPTSPIPPGATSAASMPTVPGSNSPTVVFRPTATAGKTLETKLDLLALSRMMAGVLGVTPPGAAGDDATPTVTLPGVPERTTTG